MRTASTVRAVSVLTTGEGELHHEHGYMRCPDHPERQTAHRDRIEIPGRDGA